MIHIVVYAKRAQCKQYTKKKYQNIESKRNNESQSEIKEQKPAKIPKMTKLQIEEIVEDLMEEMDLQGKSKIHEESGSSEQSTSELSESSTEVQEKSGTKKVVF